MAANYPTQSVISSSEWQKIESVFTELRKVCTDNVFPIDFVWHDYPVGECLERIRQMRCEEKLTQEQMHFFDKVGVDLQYRERHWDYMYDKAKAYYLRYGHSSVSHLDDAQLYDWLAGQRKKYRGAPRKRADRIDSYSQLTDRQRRLLEEIEIIWDASTTWGKYYNLLKKYYEEMRDTNVPNPFFVGHLNLGYWVYYVRSGRIKVSEEQKKMLNEMEFDWGYRSIAGTSFPEQATFYYFSFWYTDAVSRYKIDGTEFDIYSPSCKIAIEYDGWAWHKDKEKIEKDNKKDIICKKNKIKLIRIREEGLPQTIYAKNYFLPLPFATANFDNVIKQIYYNEFGNPLVDIDTRAHGFEILRNYRKLEDMAFYRHLEELKEYIKIHHSFPSTKIPRSMLSNWVFSLRQVKRGYAHGVLTNEQIKELDELGFIWNPSEAKLNNIYIHLKLYIEQGNDYLSTTYVDPIDNFKLGNKVAHLRQRGPYGNSYGGTQLTIEQIKKFDELRMNWMPGEPLLKPKK